MRKCVFAGTFDPPTLGHKALIEDCLTLFDEVAAAVMVNPGKQPYFTEKQREEMLRLMFPNEERVKIVFFTGTAAELLKREGTNIYVRGLKYSSLPAYLRPRASQYGGFRIRERQLFRLAETR